MTGAEPFLPIAAAPALLRALVVVFFYVVPAGIIHFIAGSLADPRREGWDPPAATLEWKQRYRLGAFFGQYVNLFLLGLFFVHLLNGLVLERAGCDPRATHVTAAAYNVAIAIDRLYVVGIVVLGLFALGGLVWSILYFAAARRAGWADPRRRDGLIVHVALIPLAVVLMAFAFSLLFRTLCPGLA